MGELWPFPQSMYNKKSIHFQMQLRIIIWPYPLGPQCERYCVDFSHMKLTRLQRTTYCRPLKVDTTMKELFFTVRCRYNAVNFSPKSSQQTLHSSPMRARYGVSVVILKSNSHSATVIAVPYVISWKIGPRYNGTWLYYANTSSSLRQRQGIHGRPHVIKSAHDLMLWIGN